MQKNFFSILTFVFLSLVSLSAQELEKISLPQPQRTGGMPLFDALNNRQSQRTYSPQVLDQHVISNLLWAAYGINRVDGRRTAPSAVNWQPFDLYLIMADGWYVYEPHEHALLKMGNEDLRRHAGSQDFVSTAPLNLIYISDYDRMTGADAEILEYNSGRDVGFISQNVYLFCASEGLATVVRGLIDKDALRNVLRLRPSQHAVLGQTVGYPGQ